MTSLGNDGKPVREVLPEVDLVLRFESAAAGDVKTLHERLSTCGCWRAERALAALGRRDRSGRAEDLIVDLSSDHRFDQSWTYGLPEIERERIVKARRIANPGCYATGAQLALYPVLDQFDGPAYVFGVSRYSGAGTTPSPKNDPKVLADNLLPYSLSERARARAEIRWQLGHKVFFMPQWRRSSTGSR